MKNEKKCGIIAIIIAVIFIILAVIFFSFDKMFLGSICSAVAFFAIMYSWLFFAAKEDEKNTKDLTQEEKEKMYQEMIRRNFDPNNYPW